MPHTPASAEDSAKAAPARHKAKFSPKDSVSLATTLAVGDQTRTLDLGFVRAEEAVSHVFAVVNDTGSRLAVQKIHASCGCTAASLDRMVLENNDTAELSLKISTGRYAGMKTIKVWLDGISGETPVTYSFAVVLQIQPVISLPNDALDELELGRVNPDSGHPACEFTATKGQFPLQWDRLKVESDNQQLEATVVSQGSDKWRVGLIVRPNATIGMLAANVKLRAMQGDVDTGYSIVRHVSAIVMGPVRAAPGSWLIGQISPGHDAGKSIRLVPTGDREGHIELLDATPSNSTTTEIVKQPGQKDRFTIRYHPPKTPGPDSGYMDAHVSSGQAIYTMRIPYLALVVPAEPAAPSPAPTLAKPSDDDPKP